MTDKCVYIYIISDSAGETATKLAQASIAQYYESGVEVHLIRKSFIQKMTDLQAALEEARLLNALILHTIISKEMVTFANEFGKQHGLFTMDILSPVVHEINRRTEIEPSMQPGALHSLDTNYFRRIEAMEFAVKYDDGKDPRGFLEADILLLGVSRTSKTPLSLFLANKNFKVANLPLIPEASLPPQLFDVNPKKIVGLMNDVDVLNQFRKERMRAYGLEQNTPYSDIEKIQKELAYAKDLYQKLGCFVINVAQRSIEETASVIMSVLKLEDHSYFS